MRQVRADILEEISTKLASEDIDASIGDGFALITRTTDTGYIVTLLTDSGLRHTFAKRTTEGIDGIMENFGYAVAARIRRDRSG